ncbi:SRPBCC family protein [Actinoallomurus rhizosphaericola]|uniref:SRPBCC family protein n=1 Tax=Actinoallomurus rhizosphaericola TaxID=2952536 RepID=UPI002093868B|nr:SRPBCC family protein [Actinoallomurus rhizosphaericola]MCO5998040.1 SRPBCC family protein [Actinoallomurus rhizosphaericola]
MTDATRSVTDPLKRTTEELPGGDLLKDLHADRLLGEVQHLLAAMGTRAAKRLLERIEGTADRLGDYSESGEGGLLSALTGGAGGGLLSSLAKGEGGGLLSGLVKGEGGGLLSGLAKGAGGGVLSGLAKGAGGGVLSALAGGGEKGSLRERLAPGLAAVKAYAKTKLEQKLRGGDKGGRGKKLKVTNIVETLDVGAPLRLVYDQWTQFEDFPSFTKKVEDVHQESDEKVEWKAQVFWSHRTWESTIIEQIPDKRIVWRSKGPKGYVDGAVAFSEIGPDMTRIALVLEYHPQGLFEHTGNLWRAQGRRARLEFKHFRRHVMTQAVLRPDEIEGWRGEIRDGKVVKDHETAMREEGKAEGRPERAPREEEEPERGREEEYEGEYAEEYEGEEEPEYGEEEPGEGERGRREPVTSGGRRGDTGRGDRPERSTRRERRG